MQQALRHGALGARQSPPTPSTPENPGCTHPRKLYSRPTAAPDAAPEVNLAAESEEDTHTDAQLGHYST